MSFQQLTLEEEADLILSDVFGGNEDAQNLCLQQLSELQGMILSDMTEEEVQEMILEHEGQLYEISDEYFAQNA